MQTQTGKFQSAQEAKTPSEMESALSAVRQSIGTISDMVDILSIRLLPVRSASKPREAVNDVDKGTNSDNSPVVRDLQEFNSVLRNCDLRIRSLIDDLEI